MSPKGRSEGKSTPKRVSAEGRPVSTRVGCDNAAMRMMLLRNMDARW